MKDVIQISFNQLHIHITGSVNASLVPFWINWSKRMYPDLSISVSVTKSALKFVSFDALDVLTNHKAWIDSWDEKYPSEIHKGLEDYTENIAIFPATINTIMQIASGFTNTPMQMALQLASIPVVIARTFPGTNQIIDNNLRSLLTRNNFLLSEELPAYSLSRGDWNGTTGFYYPFIIKTLQDFQDS